MNLKRMAGSNVCVQIQSTWMVCHFNKEVNIITPMVIRGPDGQETIPQSNLLVGKLRISDEGDVSVEIKDPGGALLEVCVNPQAILSVTSCAEEPSRLVRS